MRPSTLAGRLTPAPPFDLRQSLSFLGLFAPTQREQTIDGASLSKPVSVAGQPLLFTVTAAGSVDQPELRYTLRADRPISAATEQAALDRIRFYLSLDDDLRPFYAVGQADPSFATVIERLYGYHQVKFLTPFENACWAVLTQRTPIAVARTLKQALIERYGHALTLDDQTFGTFPEPIGLAAATPQELTELLGNERKARYLHAVAVAFASIDEHWLRVAPYAEVERWLRAIDGVGVWSASFVLVRGLGRMEQLPIEERLVEAAARLYQLPPATATRATVERLAQQYGAYQGYWAHYLRVAA